MDIKLNTLDIETINIKSYVKPYCVCYKINKSSYHHYADDYKFDDLLINCFKNIIKNYVGDSITIYVHNINFDGMLIIDALTKNNIKFDTIKKNLNVYSISFYFIELFFVFKCSYKILPMSLKELARFTEINNKSPFPYKFASIENLNYVGFCPDSKYFENLREYEYFAGKKFDFKKESINYCQNDVEILHIVLNNVFLKLYNINKKYPKILLNSNSIPSFSNKIYYKFFNNFNIEKKICIDYYNYIKMAYYGGRCEIFGNIKEGEIIHSFDFSGMYPNCMLQKFPTGKPMFSLESDVDCVGFHYISYKSDINIPILPYRNKKLMFPNGVLEGLYWYEEILLFKKNGGCVYELKYSIIYKSEEYVFKNFVEFFIKLKDTDLKYKKLWKLLLNSLYGSFAMKESDEKTIFTFSDKEFNFYLDELDIVSYTKLNDCYMINVKINEKFKKIDWKNKIDLKFHDRNLAYSAIITAKARIKLYLSFKDVLEEGGRLLYCDTDSIFAAYNHNKLGDKCGENIVWEEIYDNGVFILPKVYGLKKENTEIIKFKGVYNTGVTFKDLLKLNAEIIFKNQLVFRKKNLVLTQHYIEKKIWLTKYDKRVFINNNTETIPIIL